MEYFKYLPIAEHNGKVCVNIMNRISVDPDSTFLSLETDDGNLRSDIISKKYYDSFAYDWLVKMSNQVLDPYYDMGLSENDFQTYITNKYGSMEEAADTTLFYQNNWRNDPSIISPAAYSFLLDAQKPYWEISYDYNGTPMGYKRKEDDQTTNTNKIVEFEVSGHSYVLGDRVDQPSTEAYGYLAGSNSTYLLVEKVFGSFSNASLNQANVVLSTSVLAENIPDSVGHYWEEISALEYEISLNESKRSIRLLDNRLKGVALDRLKNSYV